MVAPDTSDPRTRHIAGVIAIFCAAVQVVFQAAIALGLPLGKASWGGGTDDIPTSLRIVSAVASLVYAFFTTVLLQVSGLYGHFYPKGIIRCVLWFLVVFLFFETALNFASPSPTERWIWGPFLLIFFASCFVLFRSFSMDPDELAEGDDEYLGTEDSALMDGR